MNKKTKELISKHFSIGSLIMEEAIQCAMVTAEFLNDSEIINDLKELADKENNPKSALAKYWENKRPEYVAQQIELF